MRGDRAWRALPPALVLGVGLWFGMMVVRLIWLVTTPTSELHGAIRLNLVAEGTGFAGYLLTITGLYDLARRRSGRAARGLVIAAIAFGAAFGIDLTYTAVSFVDNLYEHRWVFELYDWAFIVTWLAIAAALAYALGRERMAAGVTLLVVAVLAGPPRPLGELLYGWLDLAGNSVWYLEGLLRMTRLAAIVWVLALLAKGTTAQPRPPLATHGMFAAAKALWLRLIAAVGVSLLTLMVVGSKSRGGLETLKLALVTAAVINVIALIMFGLGAVRAARAELRELGRWPLALGGAASLWAAGVTIAQLPWLYKMLYRRDPYGSVDMEQHAQALAVAQPLIVAGGVALVAVAIGSFAGQRGDAELRAHAQSKGAGFVALTLVALAITQFMFPKAQSAGSFIMLSLLAAGAAFVAGTMMATLCSKAAYAIERDPGLPIASVVSDGT